MREQTVTLLQLNDSHGYLELHPELYWAGAQWEHRPAGGYARLATLLRQIRAERPGAVLAFDGGDTLHGTYPAVQSRGAALIPLLNALGFAAMSAHWEFAYGPAHFRQLANRLEYPVLAANCYDTATGRLVFSPWQVYEAGGLRIGVIGLVSNIIDKTMPPAFSAGVRFILGRDELPAHVATLRDRERVDLVVLLSHLGFPQDLQLVADVAGVDVVLSSHTHNRLHRPARVGRTLVIQSGCHGAFLGRLDLTVQDGRVVDFRHRLIDVDQSVPPDPAMQAQVDAVMAPFRAELDEVVGATATPLNRYTSLEATMDNLLLQSLLQATGAQLAFSNGWRYGAPVPPGPVRRSDLWNMIPVNPPITTVTLTGDELWAMWEENLEHTFARDPYGQMGGYVKRALGLTLYVKLENPAGQRVQAIFVGDQPLQPAQRYPAAFVTAQGVPEQYGSERATLPLHAIDALARYLTHANPVRADLQGTVRVV